MLGIGSVIGDTAIIVLLLGDTQVLQGVGNIPLLSTLRGTGSTLTSYIFDNAPTGELNQPGKAYAAAFVLIMIVLALNVFVDVFGPPLEGDAMELKKPPPVRRLEPGSQITPLPSGVTQLPSQAAMTARPPLPGNGQPVPATPSSFGGDRRRTLAAVPKLERMAVEDLSVVIRRQAGRQVGFAADPPG